MTSIATVASIGASFSRARPHCAPQGSSWRRHYCPYAQARTISFTDGFHNNWWRYIVDYDSAVTDASPTGGTLQKPEKAMY